ncbi:hypothetical protein [Streptomyces sp. PT12]|uniref:transmembrane-type terpene cyclase n=1 Tax=Streptomyces sp. PT12 TaxID=1510197 RepID=UPI000DE3C2B7|nr:hypothetical protein [Streptomyces sp. PT12]RBM14410.1 hypothetical protein DEH69_18805 [Streptomyces sp. PT12]
MLADVLSAAGGIAWTIAYLGIIRRGFADRTYGMPFVPLALNATWEFTFGFLEPSPWALQVVVNIVWFCFDVVILVTYFRYGREEFARLADARWFVPWSVAVLAGSLAVMYLTAREFAGDPDHPVDAYSALFSNLVMSMCFIGMLLRRGSSAGQSMTIAVSKAVGTAAVTVMVFDDVGSALVLTTGGCVLALDVLYAVLLRRRIREGESGQARGAGETAAATAAP